MARESRCVKVPKKEGEKTRRSLVEKGLLDNSLKPYSDEMFLYFPVIEDIPATDAMPRFSRIIIREKPSLSFTTR